MDFFVRHWAPYRRRFPSDLPVLNMGDIREKDHWVNRVFSTCNFSFILRGRGEFRRQGKTWKVEAPCVLTQWPGERPMYGPGAGPGKVPLRETWDEVYLIYDARSVPALRRRGFVVGGRPVWRIENLAGVLAQVEELRALAARATRDPEAVVDRVDRICERMILESLAPTAARFEGRPRDGHPALLKIEAELRRNPEREFDFDALAVAHGMSPSSLRRGWAALFRVPPGRYLLDLRMQKARRLLVEGEARIGEVAVSVGFDDVLYFSRRFRLATGLSPSDYRKRFLLKPASPEPRD